MRDLSIGSCNAIGSIVPTVMLGILLSGCQTGSDQGIAVAPGVEPTLPAANELYNVGRINLAAGNNGLAERNFREAVQRNDKDASSWLGLAAAYDNLGRYDLADRAYEKALSLAGETLEIVNNRGYSFMLRGHGKRALEQFERAHSLDPDNTVIRNNIQILGLAQLSTKAAPF